MKKRILLIVALLGMVCIGNLSAQAGKKPAAKPAPAVPSAPAAPTAQKTEKNGKKGPAVSFEKDTYDFGKIEKGNIAKYQFKFTNTGDEPLIITNVRPSCGCTTPTWSKEPVAPGQSGYIEAAYNSNVGHGTFTKSITVTTNIPDQTKVLFIKGEVIMNPADDPARQSPVRIQGN